MKSANFVVLCSLLWAGLTLPTVKSAGSSSPDLDLATAKPPQDFAVQFLSPEIPLVVSDGQLPSNVSQLTPLSLIQSIAKRQRYADEPVLETVSLTITRLKRMLSIDELGIDSVRAAGVAVCGAFLDSELHRATLHQASLFTLNVRLQV